jgi:hypothetical protein
MSDGDARSSTLAAALAHVEARLSAAEAALAAGGELPLDDLEGCVDALCRESARVDDATRAAARTTLEGLLARITALETAIVAKAAP